MRLHHGWWRLLEPVHRELLRSRHWNRYGYILRLWVRGLLREPHLVLFL